jgi:hypothetical protein
MYMRGIVLAAAPVSGKMGHGLDGTGGDMALTEGVRESGVWRGWYLRYGILVVAAIAVIQVVIWLAFKWSIFQNTLLGLLIVVYLMAVRAKERRLANMMVAVGVLFVVDLLLQVYVERLPAAQGFTWTSFVQYNGMYLAIALVWSYLYLRLLEWSERKRNEIEARRRAEAEPERPRVRHHRKKKKKRGRR